MLSGSNAVWTGSGKARADAVVKTVREMEVEIKRRPLEDRLQYYADQAIGLHERLCLRDFTDDDKRYIQIGLLALYGSLNYEAEKLRAKTRIMSGGER